MGNMELEPEAEFDDYDGDEYFDEDSGGPIAVDEDFESLSVDLDMLYKD